MMSQMYRDMAQTHGREITELKKEIGALRAQLDEVLDKVSRYQVVTK